MRRTLLTVLICFTAAAVFAIAMMLHKKTTRNGFVVMELFTSQGCNSCPPADALLGQYVAKKDDRIIPIAFHVDYWNRLGWKDSLSTHQYSARQSLYNSYLHGGVYTPQLIINGEVQMIGSLPGEVEKAVYNALNEVPANTIDIETVAVVNGSVKLTYDIDGILTNTNLNIVLVQHMTSTAVQAGENNGATLVNYNVARGLVTVAANVKGTNSIQLPPSINAKELSIVLFTQDGATGKITGATKQELE